MDETLSRLKQWTDEAQHIVFFGGAGVSTESGIPDFRSVDGLYHQQFRYPPEVMLSHSFFESHTADFYDFYRKKLLPVGFEPNITHRKLAQWEREGKLLAVVTQNIDGLHEMAGSRNIFNLHGTVYRNRCLRCGRRYDGDEGIAYIREADGVPRCSCGGIIKPDVVLYEESLDEDCMAGAVDAIMRADVLIVGGTSLTVWPAAGLLRYYRGSRMVLINRDPTDMDSQADLVLNRPLGEVFSAL